MIVSSIEFDTCSGPVEMDIGHRMYPEVFSEFPDLKDTLNLCNIGALIVRIGFGAHSTAMKIWNPLSSIGNY